MSSTGQIVLIIIVIIINTLVAAGYLLLHTVIRHDKEKSIIIRAFVMFLCPIIGVLFVSLSFILYKLFMSEPVDLEDVIFSKVRTKFESKPDEEKERNMIPLEEAIAISEKQDLRKLVMNVVSNNVEDSLASLTLALNSEDSETSHYAASVLQDALNNFRVHVDVDYRKILDGVGNRVQIAEELLQYMDDYLKQKVFIDMEQKNYVIILENIAEIIYENDSNRMISPWYESVSLRLLETGEYDLCEKWCLRAKQHFPDSLLTYTCLLKLYFTTSRREEFFEAIDELRSSSIVIDKETLELIRVFNDKNKQKGEEKSE